MSVLAPGTVVRTAFGIGTIRARRGRSHVVVDIDGRSFVVPAAELSIAPTVRRPAVPASGHVAERSDGPPTGTSVDVDLHGLTVNEAVERVERALNDAALQNVSSIRLVHGHGTGRVRQAVHRLLGEISSVRHFQLDPRNAGVTIVTL